MPFSRSLAVAGVAAALAPTAAHALPQQPLDVPFAPSEVSPFYLPMFGHRVAVDGDLAVVTAPGADTPASYLGGAWVYRHDGARWNLEASLLPGALPVPFTTGLLDGGVAVDGERIALGLTGIDMPTVSDCGGALVFERQGGAWVHAAVVLAPAPVAFARYGHDVDLEGDRLALLSEEWSHDPLLFERVPGQGWTFVAELTDPTITGGWDDGRIRLAGADALVLQPNQARVHVFEQSTGWALGQTLVPSYFAPGGQKPRALAADGDRFVVGAAAHPQPAGGFGLVTVFERAQGAWSEVGAIGAPPGVATFGDDVALSGSRVLVGRRASSAPNAYLYDWTPAGGELLRTYSPQSAEDPFAFLNGVSVALDGQRAVVGAPSATAAHLEWHGVAFGLEAGLLAVDAPGVDLSAGGAQALALTAGLPHAGMLHWVVGSASGTAPGVVVDGVLLPLVPDAYTWHLVAAPSAGPVQGGLGLLDAEGAASAAFALPAGTDPALAGLVVHHAYVVIDPALARVVAASEAESVALVP